jgi:inositol-pentakisphosphate 2-kinase
LLRLRKDLPTTAPCAVAQDAWERVIAPLFFEDELVCQSLVQLRPGKVIQRLNEELQGWERDYPLKGSLRSLDPRPTKRQGIYLADDEHGLLITDMTPGPVGEEVIEFKPKWLVQSPSAPPGSKRCRQCARVARMNVERKQKGETIQKAFCPLDLVSKDPKDLLRVATILLHPEPSQANINRFARWLQANQLLDRLRNEQYTLDRVGVMEADPSDEKFRAAMTLRDCTVYVRFPADAEADDQIEARLGDLDLKSSGKEQYWKDTERALIEEGWYTATEKLEDRQRLTCRLSPDRSEDPFGDKRDNE